MCPSLFSVPKSAGVVTAPPPAPVPNRADEENQQSVNSALEAEKRRKGASSTFLTGGLGDVGYGSSIQTPNVTALGKAG